MTDSRGVEAKTGYNITLFLLCLCVCALLGLGLLRVTVYRHGRRVRDDVSDAPRDIVLDDIERLLRDADEFGIPWSQQSHPDASGFEDDRDTVFSSVRSGGSLRDARGSVHDDVRESPGGVELHGSALASDLPERVHENTARSGRSKRSQRSRLWCFTQFNVPLDWEAEMDRCAKERGAYIGVELELCPTTHRPHLQGFCYFRNARTFDQARAIFVGARVVPARGTLAQNETYCSKLGRDSFKEFNVALKPAGCAGNRVSDIFLAAQNGKPLRELLVSGVVRTHSHARFYSDVCLPELLGPVSRSRGRPRCVWYYGAPGVGKTSLVRELLRTEPGHYRKIGSTKWFPCYRGERVVWIDELKELGGRDGLSLELFLSICDAGYCVVEDKGTHIPFCGDWIVVSSHRSPLEIQLNGVDDLARERAAILRRFSLVEVTRDLQTHEPRGSVEFPGLQLLRGHSEASSPFYPRSASIGTDGVVCAEAVEAGRG